MVYTMYAFMLVVVITTSTLVIPLTDVTLMFTLLHLKSYCIAIGFPHSKSLNDQLQNRIQKQSIGYTTRWRCISDLFPEGHVSYTCNQLTCVYDNQADPLFFSKLVRNEDSLPQVVSVSEWLSGVFPGDQGRDGHTNTLQFWFTVVKVHQCNNHLLTPDQNVLVSSLFSTPYIIIVILSLHSTECKCQNFLISTETLLLQSNQQLLTTMSHFDFENETGPCDS